MKRHSQWVKQDEASRNEMHSRIFYDLAPPFVLLGEMWATPKPGSKATPKRAPHLNRKGWSWEVSLIREDGESFVVEEKHLLSLPKSVKVCFVRTDDPVGFGEHTRYDDFKEAQKGFNEWYYGRNSATHALRSFAEVLDAATRGLQAGMNFYSKKTNPVIRIPAPKASARPYVPIENEPFRTVWRRPREVS